MRRKSDWPSLPPGAPGELSLVQAFLNTVDYEVDRDLLASPDSFVTWMESAGLVFGAVIISNSDLELAREARQRLRALVRANLGTPLEHETLAALNRMATDVSCRVRFHDAGEARFSVGPQGFSGVLGQLFAIVAMAQLEGTWIRLKICANDACRRAFYDASQNRRGKWCAMRRCGNKLNARAARRR